MANHRDAFVALARQVPNSDQRIERRLVEVSWVSIVEAQASDALRRERARKIRVKAIGWPSESATGTRDEKHRRPRAFALWRMKQAIDRATRRIKANAPCHAICDIGRVSSADQLYVVALVEGGAIAPLF
jgi:hypothetical protein